MVRSQTNWLGHRSIALALVAALLAATAVPAQPPATAEQKTSLSPVLSADLSRVLQKRYPTGPRELRLIQERVQHILGPVLAATVGIERGNAVGSGVIVSPDGYVLTAGHLTERSNRTAWIILSDGRRVRGRTLGIHRDGDIALIKIVSDGPWPYLETAESDSLEVGSWVLATGHPGGIQPNRAPPVRLGRVLFQDEQFICTDCTIVGGDSGGPLVNMLGEVVGIHSRISYPTTSNFHAPIAASHDNWDRLLSGEVWGAEFEPDRPVEFRPLLGLVGDATDSGCLVTQVYPGLPADDAGIRVGDVIHRFAGRPVSDFDHLNRLLLQHRPGERVALEIERGGRIRTFTVRLGFIQFELPE